MTKSDIVRWELMLELIKKAEEQGKATGLLLGPNNKYIITVEKKQ